MYGGNTTGKGIKGSENINFAVSEFSCVRAPVKM